MTAETFTPILGRLLRLHNAVEKPEYWLEADVYWIGRHPKECAVVVDHNTVSRKHAVIEAQAATFVLRNVGRNGTFVDGQRIAGEHMLCDGQTIGLASPEPLLLFAFFEETVLTDAAQTERASTAVVDRLRYDEKRLKFFLHNQWLDLPPAQFRLLHHLYLHKDQVCSRESCAAAIWGADYPPGYETGNLDKLLTKLRGNLRKVDPQATLIKLHRGLGYLLDNT